LQFGLPPRVAATAVPDIASNRAASGITIAADGRGRRRMRVTMVSFWNSVTLTCRKPV